MDATAQVEGAAAGRRAVAGEVAALAALAAAVLAVFHPCFGYGFLTWDDGIYIVDNPAVQGLTRANLVAVFTPGGVPGELLYLPLTYASYMLEIGVFGLQPTALHVTNVGLHLANVLLVFAWFRWLGVPRLAAVLGALLFAIHPLQVEPVAWAMGRKDLLAATFGILCLLSYQAHLTTRRRSWQVLALGLYALAVLAKPGLLPLPLVLALVECRVRGGWRQVSWPWLLPFAAVCAAGYWLNSRVPVPVDPALPDVATRLLAVPWLGWHWLSRLLLLNRPVPIYYWPPGAVGLGLAATAAVAGAWLWAAWRRARWAWFGLTFAGLMFVPAIKVVLDHREFITADRYGYFAFIGLGLVLAEGLAALPAGRRAAPAAVGLYLAAALGLALAAVPVWGSSTALWDRVLAVYPEAVTALMNRANTHAEAGRAAAARADYQRALARQPDHALLRTNLGAFCLAQQRYDEAREHLARAAALDPGAWRPWYLRGQVAAAQQDWPAAEAAYQQALTRQRRPEALLGLAMAYEQTARFQPAWAAYTEVLRQRPDFAVAHYNLANLYARADQATAAERSYREALRLAPDYVEAMINLALLDERTGRLGDAEAWLRQAASRPSAYRADAGAHLGRILAARGRPAAAAQAFAAALRWQPDHAAARAGLERLRPPPAP